MNPSNKNKRRHAPYTDGASNAISVPFVIFSLELLVRNDKDKLVKFLSRAYEFMIPADRAEITELFTEYYGYEPNDLEKEPDELSPNKDDLESRLASEAANDDHF